ncbi:MAG: 2,5-diamino-6-(ribosylamino)-4(3H)-pyrimidinone 5'-phosphate reductase [Methanocalculus sp. MSAO_Arc1]|uniref:2,5-diamino-6-(ribosylamino)-4(3H)-pyrimidinone 5'-phosphate reductase n=1 Tax=Methanocalculus TaxID=71151 RepID=UPI000FF3EC63|nr:MULTISPECIES: 2,5-diamino-6-(ribosylamino)-4(3H)-pyrimidinone 5'-phosphate reductase [unclassified Methanocalculus]MCP1662014.1 2,5-diamino-6-(ribosylamino)-4(3H)-pyrimidinone 5'-phosphate reductase [Methanocalculus sp. AMF5]RQD79620.1 MAG: 2,5-diamino-6-(ribosylamino)-4(3H)-pyrimidinone 5'-phosphate reductase [Methanocalculus sp. MSAO_Arc1]
MRPYVIINAAMSADGKISTRERRQVRISGQEDFARVDRMRADVDAILVGIGTVRSDDPSLTVKSPALREDRRRRGRDENPVRIVIDSRGETQPTADILNKGEGKRLIAVTSAADQNRVRELSRHAEIISCGDDTVDLTCLLRELQVRGINTLMVEGGGSVIWSFISQGLFDELNVYLGAMIIGGSTSPTLADGEGFIDESQFPGLVLDDVQRMDDGLLIRWKKKV